MVQSQSVSRFTFQPANVRYECLEFCQMHCLDLMSHSFGFGPAHVAAVLLLALSPQVYPCTASQRTV